MNTQKDYLACFNISGGAGSWARNPDKSEAIKKCLHISVSDWQNLYRLYDAQMSIMVFNVTGYDDIRYGGEYIHGYKKGFETKHDLSDKLEQIVRVKTPPLGKCSGMTSRSYMAKLDQALLEADILIV